MDDLVKGYGNLFGSEDDEDEEEGEETQQNTFKRDYLKKWGWTRSIRAVSDLTKDTWERVYDYNVIYFLNLLCFNSDTIKYDEMLRKEYRQRNK